MRDVKGFVVLVVVAKLAASGSIFAQSAQGQSASAHKVRGVHHIALNWSGSGNVDIYRIGDLIAGDYSGTSYDDDTGANGGANYTHHVCEAGTSICSNITTTVF